MNIRGKIESISITVVYPDGSRKQGTYKVKNELRAVLVDEQFMNPKMKAAFTLSKDDWRKNPTVLILDGAITVRGCAFPECPWDFIET
jgi:hypothetical protein